VVVVFVGGVDTPAGVVDVVIHSTARGREREP
jgi:hypothetical protein